MLGLQVPVVHVVFCSPELSVVYFFGSLTELRYCHVLNNKIWAIRLIDEFSKLH